MATMDVVAPSLGDKLLHVINPGSASGSGLSSGSAPALTDGGGGGGGCGSGVGSLVSIFSAYSPVLIPCLLFTKALPGAELVAENRNEIKTKKSNNILM